jgi:CheY-like chemotaxis protein
MDIQLRGSSLDGIQLTKLFRGKLPMSELPPYALGCPVLPIPILFVTANGNQYSEETLMAAGGSFTITKPVDFLKLTLALASASVRQVLTGFEK